MSEEITRTNEQIDETSRTEGSDEHADEISEAFIQTPADTMETNASSHDDALSANTDSFTEHTTADASSHTYSFASDADNDTSPTIPEAAPAKETQTSGLEQTESAEHRHKKDSHCHTEKNRKSAHKISNADFQKAPPHEVISFQDSKKKTKLFNKNTGGRQSFTRDEWILSKISQKDLMEYLRLEQRRVERAQQAKETLEKRLFFAFQLTLSLAAVVSVTYLLKDSPAILVNILYIMGIVCAFWIWKNPREK